MDEEHLVSGLDLLPTLCDYAGIEPPPHQRGVSLKPLLEGRAVDGWREFVPAQGWVKGRMIRTNRYKYVMYKGDENPTEQLFDLKADPGETHNLAYDPAYQTVLSKHRKILREFETGLINAQKVYGLFNDARAGVQRELHCRTAKNALRSWQGHRYGGYEFLRHNNQTRAVISKTTSCGNNLNSSVLIVFNDHIAPANGRLKF